MEEEKENGGFIAAFVLKMSHLGHIWTEGSYRHCATRNPLINVSIKDKRWVTLQTYVSKLYWLLAERWTNMSLIRFVKTVINAEC